MIPLLFSTQIMQVDFFAFLRWKMDKLKSWLHCYRVTNHMYLPLCTSKNLMWHKPRWKIYSIRQCPWLCYSMVISLTLTNPPPKTIYSSVAIMSYQDQCRFSQDLHIMWKLDFANLTQKGESRQNCFLLKSPAWVLPRRTCSVQYVSP